MSTLVAQKFSGTFLNFSNSVGFPDASSKKMMKLKSHSQRYKLEHPLWSNKFYHFIFTHLALQISLIKFQEPKLHLFSWHHSHSKQIQKLLIDFNSFGLGCRVKANSPHMGPEPTGGVPSVEVFQREPNPYLREFQRKPRISIGDVMQQPYCISYYKILFYVRNSTIISTVYAGNLIHTIFLANHQNTCYLDFTKTHVLHRMSQLNFSELLRGVGRILRTRNHIAMWGRKCFPEAVWCTPKYHKENWP